MDGRGASRKCPRTGRSPFALVLALLCWLSQEARSHDAELRFDIPAGDFTQTVLSFSEQAQMEVLYASENSVKDIRTPALKGRYTATEALTRLLEGTGFTFVFENDHSVLLGRGERAVGPPSSSTESTAAELGPSRRADAATGSRDLISDLQEVTVERGTRRYSRTGFYLHGGYWDGSAGCIDFGGGIFGNDKLLDDLLFDPDMRIPLLVR